MNGQALALVPSRRRLLPAPITDPGVAGADTVRLLGQLVFFCGGDALAAAWDGMV